MLRQRSERRRNKLTGATSNRSQVRPSRSPELHVINAVLWHTPQLHAEHICHA